jgi:hypothetical protein
LRKVEGRVAAIADEVLLLNMVEVGVWRLVVVDEARRDNAVGCESVRAQRCEEGVVVGREDGTMKRVTTTHSCGATLLLRLSITLPATVLPATVLPPLILYVAACCACAVAGSQPLLVMPSCSMRRYKMSSVMTSKCSIAARRESSLAEQQWMKDLLVGLCSTIAAPIFLEEVGAKLITSRRRFGP